MYFKFWSESIKTSRHQSNWFH